MTVYVGHLHLPFSKCFQFLFVNTLIYIVLAGAQQACVNVSPSIPLASWERALPVLTFINASLSNQTVEICGSGSPWAGLWRVTGTSVTQKLVDVVAINGVTITNDTSVVHAPQCAGARINPDKSCNQEVPLQINTPATSSLGLSSGALQVWFAVPKGTSSSTPYRTIFSLNGALAGTHWTVHVGEPASTTTGKALVIEANIKGAASAGGRHRFYLPGRNDALMDGTFHSLIIRQPGTLPGLGQVLIDLVPVDLIPDSNFNSATASLFSYQPLWLSSIEGVTSVSLGGWKGDSVYHTTGPVVLWHMSATPRDIKPCEALVWYEVEKRHLLAELDARSDEIPVAQFLSASSDPASFFVPTQSWVSYNAGNGLVQFTRLGRVGLWAPNNTVATEGTWASLGVLGAASTTAAGSASGTSTAVTDVWGATQLVADCINSTIKANNLAECPNWKTRAPFENVSLNAACSPSVVSLSPQLKSKTLKRQFEAARAIAATTLGVTTVTSVGASSALSATASHALGALSAAGTDVGLSTALSAAGVEGFVQHLQYFVATAGITASTNEAFSNLGQALEWINYQVPIGANSGTSSTSIYVSINNTINGINDLIESLTDPLVDRVWASATNRLICIAVVSAAVLLVHFLVLVVWGHWEWLTKRKLPGLLVFPKVELMLMFSMLTGASQASGMLLASADSAGMIVLGIVALLVCFLFLWFCAYLLFSLILNQPAFGLNYVTPTPLPDNPPKSGVFTLLVYKRMHGTWGDPLLALDDHEPRRTKHYTRSHLNIFQVINLISSHRKLVSRVQSSLKVQLGSHQHLNHDDHSHGGGAAYGSSGRISLEAHSNEMGPIIKSVSPTTLKLGRISSRSLQSIPDLCEQEELAVPTLLPPPNTYPGGSATAQSFTAGSRMPPSPVTAVAPRAASITAGSPVGALTNRAHSPVSAPSTATGTPTSPASGRAGSPKLGGVGGSGLSLTGKSNRVSPLSPSKPSSPEPGSRPPSVTNGLDATLPAMKSPPSVTGQPQARGQGASMTTALAAVQLPTGGDGGAQQQQQQQQAQEQPASIRSNASLTTGAGVRSLQPSGNKWAGPRPVAEATEEPPPPPPPPPSYQTATISKWNPQLQAATAAVAFKKGPKVVAQGKKAPRSKQITFRLDTEGGEEVEGSCDIPQSGHKSVRIAAQQMGRVSHSGHMQSPQSSVHIPSGWTPIRSFQLGGDDTPPPPHPHPHPRKGSSLKKAWSSLDGTTGSISSAATPTGAGAAVTVDMGDDGSSKLPKQDAPGAGNGSAQAMLDKASSWVLIQASELSLVALEVEERLGELYEGQRGDDAFAGCFKLVQGVYTVILGFAIGVMAGRGWSEGSVSSRGMTAFILAVQVIFAGMSTLSHPYVDQLRGWADIMCLWFEAGSTMCALALNFPLAVEATKRWENARLALSLATLIVQVMVVWWGLVLKIAACRKSKKDIEQVEEEYRQAEVAEVVDPTEELPPLPEPLPSPQPEAPAQLPPPKPPPEPEPEPEPLPPPEPQTLEPPPPKPSTKMHSVRSPYLSHPTGKQPKWMLYGLSHVLGLKRGSSPPVVHLPKTEAEMFEPPPPTPPTPASPPPRAPSPLPSLPPPPQPTPTPQPTLTPTPQPKPPPQAESAAKPELQTPPRKPSVTIPRSHPPKPKAPVKKWEPEAPWTLR